jgi:uncharacterized membrane protein
MRFPHRDLLAVTAGAAVSALIVLTVPVTAIRAAFALPLCFVLPGYAATAAIFGRSKPGGARLTMLVLAMSLATLVLGSLVLDVPRGLRAGPWVGLLTAVVVATSAIAWRRRGESEPVTRPLPRLTVGTGNALLLAIALLGTTSAIVLSEVPLRAAHALGYTELWLTGPDKMSLLRIGVTSAEQHATTYRLEVRVGSAAPTVVAPDLTLRPAEQKRFTVRVPTRVSGSQPEAVAILYKAGDPEVYRSATARLPPDTSVSP